MNGTMPALEDNDWTCAWAAPMAEHYLLLLYLTGVCRSGERLAFPVGGFDGGTVSMLAVRAC